MVRRLFVLLSAATALVLFATPAVASSGYNLFGHAHPVHPGSGSNTAIELRSVNRNFGGVNFEVASGLTFADINTLSTDYMFTTGSCGGGAPRFQINVIKPDGSSANVFVYIGPPPSYVGCPPDIWLNTNNLMLAANPIDTTQLGGPFYDPAGVAQATYGSYPVTGIQLVTDGGWAQLVGNTQVVQVDDVQINDATFTFEPQGNGS
ncbi:MAG TPA: hypothetical protein VKE27_03355 [Candidatus Dormibacteraeota bacterium]|nr:hypothetical protein [Candidatus Dormibacteraeota bacterium]